jgi:hypothetical protein
MISAIKYLHVTHEQHKRVSYENLTLVLPQSEVFRDVTLCHWASSFRHFK